MSKPTDSPNHLLQNSRFWILALAVTSSVLIAGIVQALLPSGNLQIIRIEQIYGFVAIGLIYFALLASPLTIVFPRFRFRDQYIFARRGIGVSGFYFATLHTLIAFFGQLNGFSGLKFLNGTYHLSLLAGTLGLAILLMMAATSFDSVIRKFSYRRWKLAHRTVYIAGIGIILHFALIGSHFGENIDPIMIVTYLAIAVLLVLEILRIRIYLRNRHTEKLEKNA
jgi:methionine sulfoxide reductase heme-binding subunit